MKEMNFFLVLPLAAKSLITACDPVPWRQCGDGKVETGSELSDIGVIGGYFKTTVTA
jgi:hypothetical protein